MLSDMKTAGIELPRAFEGALDDYFQTPGEKQRTAHSLKLLKMLEDNF